MKLNYVYLGLIGVLIFLVISLSWKIDLIRKDAVEQSDALKQSIIESDKLLKESEGRYAKLVEYYTSEKELSAELRSSNKELYKSIKKQDERILSLTNSILTLQGKVDAGFGKIDPADSNQVDLALRYPNENDPFIKWDGSVNRKSAAYKGEWSFGKLPIQILVTEESRGLWKERIIGPNWLIVDSLNVKSLPPDEYPVIEERKIQFMVGTSYYAPLNTMKTGSVGIGVGMSLVDRHYFIVGANTNQEVGLSYYYKFKTTKRKK